MSQKFGTLNTIIGFNFSRVMDFPYEFRKNPKRGSNLKLKIKGWQSQFWNFLVNTLA